MDKNLRRKKKRSRRVQARVSLIPHCSSSSPRPRPLRSAALPCAVTLQATRTIPWPETSRRAHWHDSDRAWHLSMPGPGGPGARGPHTCQWAKDSD